eukprot:TRINITY_DN247_c0_g1_i1.p2 TRINITY_DN247_c0_g1~~TRINITY_DN247_c0_g1_i1.p2  ORF type:complete len:361 (+),score=177.02 TRINITY_DN247_c0_g1_i1:65-1147(+)
MLTSCLAMAALGHASMTNKEGKFGSTFYSGVQFAHGPTLTHRMEMLVPFGVTDLRVEHVPGWTATIETEPYWSVKGRHSTSTTRVTKVVWESDDRTPTSGGVEDRAWFRPQFRASFDCELYTGQWWPIKVPQEKKDDFKKNYLAKYPTKTEADFQKHFEEIDTRVWKSATRQGELDGEGWRVYFPTTQMELKADGSGYIANADHYAGTTTPWKSYAWTVVSRPGVNHDAAFAKTYGADKHAWIATAPYVDAHEWEGCSAGFTVDGEKQGMSPKAKADKAVRDAELAVVREEMKAAMAKEHMDHHDHSTPPTPPRDDRTYEMAVSALVLSTVGFIVLIVGLMAYVNKTVFGAPAKAAAPSA